MGYDCTQWFSDCSYCAEMNTPTSLSSGTRILAIDDDPDITKAAALVLERRGYEVTVANTPASAWEEIGAHCFDAVLLDLNFAKGQTDGTEGLAFLERLVSLDETLAIIIVTGHSGITIAVQAMRLGAFDFVMKPWNNQRFLATVAAAVQEHRLRQQTDSAQTDKRGSMGPLMIGESQTFQDFRETISKIAQADSGVLIIGSPGIGKSLAARSIHDSSKRRNHPLITLDLPGLQIGDYDQVIIQAFQDADGGSLLLDNLDQLPISARGSLTKALTGDRYDIRFISTARRKEKLTQAEGPGGDIMERVATIEIAVPPLTSRDGDLVLLGEHFLKDAAKRNGQLPRKLSQTAADKLSNIDWTEEVRGLALIMERASVFSNSNEIEAGDLIIDNSSSGGQNMLAPKSLAETEKAAVETALQRHNFNISRTAADLGLSRAALYRKMARHEL